MTSFSIISRRAVEPRRPGHPRRLVNVPPPRRYGSVWVGYGGGGLLVVMGALESRDLREWRGFME